MNFYLFLGTVSLVFQLAILALLIRSFEFKQQLNFRTHGLTMTIAFAVHIINIAVVMVPSFVIGLVPKILQKPTSLIALSSILMTAAGTATIILATWIIGAWRLRQSTKFCAPKRRFMSITFMLWLVSLSLGIILYFALNWSLLFG